MLQKWFERHFKLAGVLLLLLAAVNGWIAYSIFPRYTLMALANGAMAFVSVLGVILFWGVGEPR